MMTVYLLLKVKYVLAAVCEGCEEADPVLQVLLNKKEESSVHLLRSNKK